MGNLRLRSPSCQLTYSLGGAVAVAAFLLFPDNPVILPIFGFFFSLPCFYIITQMPNYAQVGRFILLTYVGPASVTALTPEPHMPVHL